MLISGPGGVGKSTVVGKIIEGLEYSEREVKITASTGIAAINVGGETIHRFLGTQIIGSINELEREIAGGSMLKWAKPGRIREADVLIVDEVSMLTGDYIDMMDHWMRHVRNKIEPFGGVQMIFVGDFFQLPPVIKDRRRVKKEFAFESNAWAEVELEIHDLTTNFRQNNPTLIDHLNSIRRGTVSEATLVFFNCRVGAEVSNATKLCPTNAEAQSINLKRLLGLPGKIYTYKARVDGTGAPEQAIWAAEKRIVKNCIADQILNLKVGCPVLFLRNDYDLGIRNGESGTVLSCESDSVTVEHSDGHVVCLEQAKWESKNAEGIVEAELFQIPVKPSFAITVHKSQGATLDRLKISSGKMFAAGQMYVALSRMRRIEGLTLTRPLVARDIRADPKVVGFYTAGQSGKT